MSKLAIFGVRSGDEAVDKQHLNSSEHVRRWKLMGRKHSVGPNEYYIVYCLLRDSFIFPSEATAENPATNLPNDWIIAWGVKVNNQGRTTYTYTDLPDIVIPAGDITDDVFNRSISGNKYRFVQPQYDSTDPDAPVLLGAFVVRRTGERVPYSIDSTDPDNPVYEWLWPTTPEDVAARILRWTEPAKLVTHVGSGKTLKVRPEDLEDDGTYIYKRQEATVDVPAYEMLQDSHPQLIEWAKDNAEGGRPAEFKEEFQYGRMEPLPF